jgi:hypothetical protein
VDFDVGPLGFNRVDFDVGPLGCKRVDFDVGPLGCNRVDLQVDTRDVDSPEVFSKNCTDFYQARFDLTWSSSELYLCLRLHLFSNMRFANLVEN